MLGAMQTVHIGLTQRQSMSYSCCTSCHKLSDETWTVQRKTDGSGMVSASCTETRRPEARLHVQPVEAALAERPRLRELQHAAADIGAQMVQVAVHRVRAAPEVQVVREVQRRLVLELPGDLCANRSQAHQTS